MRWQLTAAIQTGDIDTVAYAEIQIQRVVRDRRQRVVRVSWSYGNTVDSNWVPGSSSPSDKKTSKVLRGTDYDTWLTTHLTNDGELTSDAMERSLYEYLAAEAIIDPGSVV